MYISPRVLVNILALIFIAPQAQAQRVRTLNTISKEVSPPTVITSLVAPYTGDTRNRGIEGRVTVEGVIDANGTMTGTHVVNRLGFGLDESALQSVREWTFSPAMRNGVPVSTAAQVDVEFNLRDANALPIDPGITPPKLLPDHPFPQYTEEARRAKIPDAKVILQTVVKTDGSADVIRVVQGFGYGMTDSAIETLKQWKFTPARIDGKDIDVALDFEFNFQLKTNTK